MNKKEIYNKYGIEYESGKIRAPKYGWISELLKTGNSKTGKAVLTWSMNQTTCPMHCKGCYADAGCYNFKSVKETLARHTELARENLDFVESAIRAQLETAGAGKEIRIHAVGDFFSAAYADMWKRIAADFPADVFWTYTKVRSCETLFDELDNANIVRSILPGIGLNYGHSGYILKAYAELKSRGENVHICRCGIDPDHHCAGCHKCSEYKYVLFVEHSTEYRADLDPDTAEIKKIIDAQ